MNITQELSKKVLDTVDAGLCSGVGKPTPGQMCVEAAVCFALGEPHGDKPTCVSEALRSFKVSLNDKEWSSNAARAKGLRRIAIAQLGTAGTLDEIEFCRRVAEMTIRKTVPAALRLVSESVAEPHKANLIAAAFKCEQEGTEVSAREAEKAAYATYATYAAYATANAANAAAYATAYAAANAATYAATNAANAAAKSEARDKVLAEYAEDVVQILIEMETPGSKFLFLTEV